MQKGSYEAYTMNQRKSDALNVDLDGCIKLEFHGAKVIPLSGNGVSPMLIRHRPDAVDSPPFSNRPGRHGGRLLPVPARKNRSFMTGIRSKKREIPATGNITKIISCINR